VRHWALGIVHWGRVLAFGSEEGESGRVSDASYTRGTMSFATGSRSASLPAEARAVLAFWLGDACSGPMRAQARNSLWFSANPETDRDIRTRFGALRGRAIAGELDGWADDPRGALALVVLLDQFSRNLCRGTADAFASDAKALAIARAVIDRGADRELEPVERVFLYLPFEHSEALADQERSLELFGGLAREVPEEWRLTMEGNLKWAVDHHRIVARFGRFPHRNTALGRESTEEEREYLEGGAATFGQ